MSDKKQGDKEQGEQNSEFESFQRLLKGTIAVPKEEVDEKLDERKQRKDRKRREDRS